VSPRERISQAIRNTSDDRLQVDTGSLYPALHRLARQRWITASWQTSSNNQRTRVYRLTAEATGPRAEAQGVLTADEVREMIAGLRRLEEDPSSVLMKFPDMWVIARRR
jgi:DNA-binding PadR family transcriptional regulator